MEETAAASAPAKKETTEVKQVNLEEVDEILAIPGAESAMHHEDNPKPGIFTSKPVNMDFLDKETDDDDDDDNKDDDSKKTVSAEETKNLLNPESDTDDDKKQEAGRPKIDKKSLSALAGKLIEKELIVPFEDETPLEEYTMEDYMELFEANITSREKKIREETPAQFFDSLPDELKYAAKYVADGGSDIKGLFRHLAASEEIKDLNPESDSDQEIIIRSYLQATKFGDSAEIEEEIDQWRDHDQIEAKAKKFKPKLDAMQQQVVEYKLHEQEELRRKRDGEARKYMDSVYETLKPGEINGLKLDRKTQEKLYSGMVEPSYNSINGTRTNQLGHLLEKYQFVEPNHGLIAEALWLLSDPDGYREKIAQQGANKSTEKNVRMLKTEQSQKTAASSSESDEAGADRSRPKKKAGISRPQSSFFRR